MITIVCVIAAVFAYAFIRERQDRRRVERERNVALQRAGQQEDLNRKMELERAFRDGVEAASETNALYNSLMRQVACGQGTVKIKGTRGAPVSLDEWRRNHENPEHHS